MSIQLSSQIFALMAFLKKIIEMPQELISYLSIIYCQFKSVVKLEAMEEQAEKVTVDFQYFIQMAIEKKMAWITLTHLLTDLAATPVKSKQVIKLLLQELETWVSKVENEPKTDVVFRSTNK